ncbi:MAG: plasmid mobilization relaxosome protein MobC [Oscillospiraceae bacterium]|nr:plasmid mobilization relaxosome protein MobC [Oscillospiraceae bacterium]
MTYRKNKIQLHIMLSDEDNAKLIRDATLSGLSVSSYLRLLIRGYEPQPAPGKDFEEMARQILILGNNLNALAARAAGLGFIDAPRLKEEARKWHETRAHLYAAFLEPKKRIADEEDEEGGDGDVQDVECREPEAKLQVHQKQGQDEESGA